MTLTINPSGSQPFDCQWYQDGLAVAGATNTSYSFLSLAGTNTYYCSVSNAYSYSEGSGPVFSSTATVVARELFLVRWHRGVAHHSELRRSARS